MNKGKKLGEFKTTSYCRFCKSKNIHKFIVLGNQPLAGGFLKKGDFKNEKFYPLGLYFCRNCYLIQTTVVVNKDKLFKSYFYKTSAIKTLLSHFKKNATLLSKFFKKPQENFVLEIGCNDGNFLNEMSKRKFKVLGIDPAENIIKPLIAKKLPIINNYFSKKEAKEILKINGKAGLIVSTNTLAHIENMHDVFNGINLLLDDEGFLYFENHYLGNLLKETQYDMIYHEHLYYYSLLSLSNFLKKHSLEIFNIRKIPIHGGSIGLFVQKKKGPFKISKRVKDTIAWEKRHKLDSLKTFEMFSKQVEKKKKELLDLLSSLRKKNKTIVGYGASGRGTVISNYAGLDNKLLDYVVDDSKIKQGFYTPGTHLKIVPSTLNNKNRPDYTLLFAWSFYKEIKNRNKKYKKNGGKFITPLPKVRII
ncbi:MAG: hypothetical protein A2W22_03850 [Candidatus Levybacteria bacterium RBG_16_35_11]|nr:MAG: hypothetical protein A2W22_03850 [Candidatus Levybacteria bacterium RBG_16_35_11]